MWTRNPSTFKFGWAILEYIPEQSQRVPGQSHGMPRDFPFNLPDLTVMEFYLSLLNNYIMTTANCREKRVCL